jgi:RNA polymerase sigma-70 factor (ECF subfamily)
MNGNEPTASDEQLAEQALNGSMAAFEELVIRYEARVYGFVFQSCRNVSDAREITQDTFIRAFSALGQFNPRFAFASWLFAIARRKCIDFHRARRQIPASDEAIPEQADLNDPRELAVQNEERQSLWAAARRVLSEIQFQTIWLKYAEGMDVAEIARVAGKTSTHVKVMLFRARRRLAREFEADPRALKSVRSDVSPLACEAQNQSMKAAAL